jgi:rhamnogalacturonyl hydrolase YesR
MKRISPFLLLLWLQVSVNPLYSQVKDDVNTPLHLLPADYTTPYSLPTKITTKQLLDRVFNYIQKNTPPELIDTVTQKIIANPSDINLNVALKKGVFRITSYEWGVVYSALLNAYKNMGDPAYAQYVKDRQEFIAKWTPVFREKYNSGFYANVKEFPLRQPVSPHALDDGGAVTASMIKAKLAGMGDGLEGQIDFFVDYIMKKEFRLADKTIARNRPLPNSLWLDDLYMALPSLVQIGKLKKDKSYFDEAIFQLEAYSKRMFVPEKGLYMHGWIQDMTVHPAFHWARANGWALLTMTEILDALPNDHPKRSFVLDLFKKHVAGIVKYQDGSGFWHQLLDKNDSYLETSATAIYSYCISKGCNEGWLDKMAYATTAALAWNAAASKVNAEGQVEGTCVGTGMAFDPAFYYHRPVSKFAAHGYGPLLLAASEMYKLLDKGEFKMNDSAMIFCVK